MNLKMKGDDGWVGYAKPEEVIFLEKVEYDDKDLGRLNRMMMMIG